MVNLLTKARSVLDWYQKINSNSLISQFKGWLSKLVVMDKSLLKKRLYLAASILDLVLIMVIAASAIKPVAQITNSIMITAQPLHPLTEIKDKHEIFGFAPFWTFNKLDNVDFSTLTTLSYFSVPVLENGDLDRASQGFQTFKGRQATQVFQRAHQSGTRVVLTLTQMNNGSIINLLENPEARSNAIAQIVEEVDKRGIDGINIDFEYSGDPGQYHRDLFSDFVYDLTKSMHDKNPNSYVTVSVYAASVKDPKIYDIARLTKASDDIFMMAYDFAVAGSDQAMPTSPLYGYKEGQYWYDVATAVDDFLSQMPAEKLILGVPWYGYNYLVYEPGIKAETRPYYSWRGRPVTQTYGTAVDSIKPEMDGVLAYQEGWDDLGQVGWKAYYATQTDTWRMLFLDDVKSLGAKYDFAKSKNLKGVGIWALGFDDGKNELWSQLKDSFGTKVVDNSIIGRVIASEENN